MATRNPFRVHRVVLLAGGEVWVAPRLFMSRYLAIITGASRGFGRQLAVQVARQTSCELDMVRVVVVVPASWLCGLQGRPFQHALKLRLVDGKGTSILDDS